MWWPNKSRTGAHFSLPSHLSRTIAIDFSTKLRPFPMRRTSLSQILVPNKALFGWRHENQMHWGYTMKVEALDIASGCFGREWETTPNCHLSHPLAPSKPPLDLYMNIRKWASLIFSLAQINYNYRSCHYLLASHTTRNFIRHPELQGTLFQ